MDEKEEENMTKAIKNSLERKRKKNHRVLMNVGERQIKERAREWKREGEKRKIVMSFLLLNKERKEMLLKQKKLKRKFPQKFII